MLNLCDIRAGIVYYSDHLHISEFEFDRASLWEVKTENNKRPKDEPCGTSLSMILKSDWRPWKETH